MTGEMPDDCGGPREGEWFQGLTKEEVMVDAMAYNQATLKRVRENEWSPDVHKQQWEDHEEGFQSKPVPLNLLMEEIHDECLITRGIPVREYREGRVTGQERCFTTQESMINSMIWGKKRMVSEHFDHLAWLVISFFVRGIGVRMFKRDIRKAFSCCPVAVSDLDVM